MLFDTPFTKENLNACLKELGKEFRKRSGTKMPAEIILIGGAAILANYGFRNGDYERVYQEIRKNEKEAKELLVEFDNAYPGEIKTADIDSVLKQARRRRGMQQEL